MRILFTLGLLLMIGSCSAQKKSAGILKGKVDIGPLCPQEPCNPSAELLKQIYSSYQVLVMDTAATKVLFKISIQQDASFNMKISAGEYIALIKPVAGSGFKNESKRISISKGTTTEIFLNYDTGLR